MKRPSFFYRYIARHLNLFFGLTVLLWMSIGAGAFYLYFWEEINGNTRNCSLGASVLFDLMKIVVPCVAGLYYLYSRKFLLKVYTIILLFVVSASFFIPEIHFQKEHEQKAGAETAIQVEN